MTTLTPKASHHPPDSVQFLQRARRNRRRRRRVCPCCCTNGTDGDDFGCHNNKTEYYENESYKDDHGVSPTCDYHSSRCSRCQPGFPGHRIRPRRGGVGCFALFLLLLVTAIHLWTGWEQLQEALSILIKDNASSIMVLEPYEWFVRNDNNTTADYTTTGTILVHPNQDHISTVEISQSQRESNHGGMVIPYHSTRINPSPPPPPQTTTTTSATTTTDRPKNPFSSSTLPPPVIRETIPSQFTSDHAPRFRSSSSSSSPSSSSLPPTTFADDTPVDESTAACLLIKDDNHWLIEWLAYHYFVFNLRSLIVVPDPSSQTSPLGILQRWNATTSTTTTTTSSSSNNNNTATTNATDFHGRIHIQIWNSDSFLPKWVEDKVQEGKLSTTLIHRYRQQFFYTACLRAYQKQKHFSWVLLSDTDEFIRTNPYYYHPSSLNQQQRMKLNGFNASPSVPIEQPGSVLRTIHQHEQSLVLDYIEQHEQQFQSRQRPHNHQPQQRQQQQQERSADRLQLPICLHIPRIQISSRKEPINDETSPSPSGFNASHFLTLSWFYHNGHEITTGFNLDGKNLIHMGRLLRKQIPKKAQSVHYVIPGVCPAKNGTQPLLPDSWLLIHHYPGTYEQYVFRDDPRNAIAHRPKRDYAQWQSIGTFAMTTNRSIIHIDPNVRDDSLVPWLSGFIRTVGIDEAQRLLEGVGQVGYQ